MPDLIVIGAGPAGVLAALRAADLGARTTLVASGEFGGMAANDGPVPVRTLAHASRLMREARQLGRYGVTVSAPVLDYPRLLTRVREVVNDVRSHSSLRQQIDRRPQDRENVGLPRHRRTGGGHRRGGGDRHCRRDASGRVGTYTARLSDLRRDPG